MKSHRIAILGATGEVGREMLKILEERNYPVASLHLLASARSVGKTLRFRGEDIPVEEATPDAFRTTDVVLGAASADVAKAMAPHITAAGAVFVDNSSAFRMQEDVPLIVPEINPEDAMRHSGILSNPNCSTIITLMAVKGIHKLSPIRRMVAATYQAVSGAGAAGPVELADQMRAIVTGEPVVCHTFPYQIAENLIPQIGSFLPDGYTTEEMKMQNEGRKILHQPDLLVSCTCVRVPVVRSHSIAVSVYAARPLTPEEVRDAVAREPGCRLVDDPAGKRYPMPKDTSDGDEVFVGRIRPDLAFPGGVSLFCCGDQVRKGAATNAVQIAQLLLNK